MFYNKGVFAKTASIVENIKSGDLRIVPLIALDFSEGMAKDSDH